MALYSTIPTSKAGNGDEARRIPTSLARISAGNQIKPDVADELGSGGKLQHGLSKATLLFEVHFKRHWRRAVELHRDLSKGSQLKHI